MICISSEELIPCGIFFNLELRSKNNGNSLPRGYYNLVYCLVQSAGLKETVLLSRSNPIKIFACAKLPNIYSPSFAPAIAKQNTPSFGEMKSCVPKSGSSRIGLRYVAGVPESIIIFPLETSFEQSKGTNLSPTLMPFKTKGVVTTPSPETSLASPKLIVPEELGSV
ncbi:hypothetical protein Ahy_A05g024822 isoform B [Arachis hypogaea]|uniref:Uncharacterized protein n=1 Tax=Arachis hypogaea TaxID=3818 RepID=A0A445D744_ARAHY|nr:hypothetical protein Ahy_A05g024822 isoform B [Arachis hypogaea]